MSFGPLPTAGILTAGGLSLADALNAKPPPPAHSQSDAQITGQGLVVRFSPIRGVTPPSALNRRVWLPAFLDPFTVGEQALHAEYDTLSAGHFSQPAAGPPGARQLRTVQGQAITVEFDAPWLVATGQDPVEVRKALFEILRARKPVRMLVHVHPPRGDEVELDMHCTLRSVNREIRNGELETRYLTISIVEWRDPSTSRRSSSPSGTSRKKGVALPTTASLRATDTLASLSYEYYGRYDYWRHIRDANGISKKVGQKTPLVQLPGAWKVGAKVKIPLVAK